MKKMLLGIALCLLLAVAGFSQGFSLKVTGGACYISSGDYNDGIDGMNAAFAAAGFDTLSGTLSKLTFGFDFGGELIYNFTPNWGVGLGVSSMRITRDNETVTGTLGMFTDTFSLQPTITCIPVTLNIYYMMPMSGWDFHIFAGVGYYITKMKVTTATSLFSGILSQTDTFDSNDISHQIGFQGGIGLDIPISGNFAFVVDVTGRYVSLTDIKGDYVHSGSILGFPFSNSGTDAFFYKYNTVIGGTTYKQLTWDTDADRGMSLNAAHAKFDLSGVSARAGFKISF